MGDEHRQRRYGDPMPEPQRDEVLEFLLDIEAGVHSGGWDLPPVFGLMGTLLVDGKHEAAFAPFPLVIPDPPAPGLLRLADRFLNDIEPEVMRKLIAHVPRFMASMFISEIYHYEPVDEADRENYRNLLQSGRKLADIPGAIEARMVTAVDLAGRGYRIMRKRGQPAATDYTDLGLHGPAAEGLRKTLLACVRARPEYASAIAVLEATDFTEPNSPFTEVD